MGYSLQKYKLIALNIKMHKLWAEKIFKKVKEVVGIGCKVLLPALAMALLRVVWIYYNHN